MKPSANTSDPRKRPESILLAATALLLVLALLAGLGSRWGWWDFRTGFALLRWSGYGSILLLLVDAAFMVADIRRRAWSRSLVALAAMIPAAWLLSGLVSWKMQASRVPPIHDITTDIGNPPHFEKILPLRKDAPNPAVYPGAEVSVLQREAYPDIKSLVVNMPVDQALTAAENTARKMGWETVSVDRPGGRLEAVARTFWFGFIDDVVVRVTPVDGIRSVVDVRSVSRVGKSDVGANAARIRKFLSLLPKV